MPVAHCGERGRVSGETHVRKALVRGWPGTIEGSVRWLGTFEQHIIYLIGCDTDTCLL
jgi:hypothetical protein